MSSGHQRIKWRRNTAENFNRLSRVHERYRQTTDDRQQTDGRTTTYSERERCRNSGRKLTVITLNVREKKRKNRSMYEF